MSFLGQWHTCWRSSPRTCKALDWHASQSLAELNLCLVQIGQLIVFESGAVKLRIGAVLYELEAGISPGIREEVAAISLGEEQAIPFLGEVAQHAVITPDMDHLLRCASRNTQ